MLRRKPKQPVPGPPAAQSFADASHVTSGETTSEVSSVDTPRGPADEQPVKEKKVRKSRSKSKSFNWKAWLPAAVTLVIAIFIYQNKESQQLQDVISSVKNLPAIDDLIQRVNLSDLPAFNLSAALWTEPQHRIGVRLAEAGLKPKHPVAIVPGFVTSGLELWQGLKCAKKYFRQRMWGSLNMLQTFLNDKECWFKHLMMDPVTGLDPEGIKLRAIEGFEAVDFFIQGYWVFNKMIEALADVGYTSTQMACMSYDWRMAAPGTEVRDGYFSRMRATIELLHRLEGEKVVMVAHSMGDITVRNFFAWVEAQQVGWVEEHVHAFVNVAGTSLGVPKAASALLSGELRDTTHLGALSYLVAENMVPREMRAKVWRSWGAIFQMLPGGGNGLWGNSTWAPDDDEAIKAAGRSFGAMITSVPAAAETMKNDELDKNSSAKQQADFILQGLRNWVLKQNTDDLKQHPVEPLSVEESLKMLPEVLGPVFASHAHNWAGQPPRVFPKPPDGTSHPSLSCNTNPPQSTHHTGQLARSTTPSATSAGIAPPSGGENPQAANSTSPGANAAHSSSLPTADVSSPTSLSPTDSLSPSMSAPPADHPSASSTSAAPTEDPAASEPAPPNADDSSAHSSTAPHAAALTNGVPSSQSARPTDAAPASTGAEGSSCGVGHRRWFRTVDVAQQPLPYAPSMKMYCLYGVGIPTERGYHYLHHEPHNYTEEGSREWRINMAVTDLPSGLDRGVQMSDGDGTVPLISLGLMCYGGWRTKRLNPADIPVVSREYKHISELALLDPRGGPLVADHVSILGNIEVLADVLRVVTGTDSGMEDIIISNIPKVAAQVDFDNL